MGKKKYRQFSHRLYEDLLDTTLNHSHAGAGEITSAPDQVERYSEDIPPSSQRNRGGPPLKMGKFRFQLLHLWLVAHFSPCRVADIGGGKGLLAYLLQKSQWEAVVIDPCYQSLPDKYKDLEANARVRISATEMVPHMTHEFETHMGTDFDLLLGMHAHGCNVKIIDAVATYRCNGVLFPCCIIDEPLSPLHGTHWLQCLVDYAHSKGLEARPFRLQFSGQNIGLCISPDRKLLVHGGREIAMRE